jgi:hypothetical protein
VHHEFKSKTNLIQTAQFLNSPQFKTYLENKGYESIEDLHVAFANKTRIRCMIKSEQLLRFPHTDGLEGVVYEWRTRHQNEETVFEFQLSLELNYAKSNRHTFARSFQVHLGLLLFASSMNRQRSFSHKRVSRWTCLTSAYKASGLRFSSQCFTLSIIDVCRGKTQMSFKC